MTQKFLSIAAALVVIVTTAVVVESQTNYTEIFSAHIQSSLIDSTVIGSGTPAGGTFTAPNFSGSFGTGTPAANTAQVGWGQGSAGDFDLYDQSGTSAGGFNFYRIGGSTTTGSPGSPVFQISAGGSITGAGVVNMASLNLSTNPPNCSNGYVSQGISGTGAAECGPQIQGIVITTGICTTPSGTAYGECTSGPYSWPHSFADSGYAITCNALNPSSTGSATSLTIYPASKGAASFYVNLVNADANAANSTTAGEIDCQGVHN